MTVPGGFNPEIGGYGIGTSSIGAVGGLVLDAAELGYNIYQDQRDYNFLQEQYGYQKVLNKTEMERQDNAYSRAVTDAINAGLSPLAVSGGAASNTGVNNYNSSGHNVRFPSILDSINVASQIYRMKIMKQELSNLQKTGKSIDLNNARMSNDNKYYEQSGLPSNSNSTERMVSDIISYLVKQNPKGRLSDVPTLGSLWDSITQGTGSAIENTQHFILPNREKPLSDTAVLEQQYKYSLARQQASRDSEHQRTLDRLNTSNARNSLSERDSKIRYENDDNYKWYLSHKNSWTKDVMREWYNMSSKQKRAFNNDMKEWFYWRTHSGSKLGDPKR